MFTDCAFREVKPPRHRRRLRRTERKNDKSTQPEYSPESRRAACEGMQALWRAVVTQALMDAKTNRRKKQEQFAKHEAERWLFHESRDFTTVCELAGLDPDFVRMKAKHARGMGWIKHKKKKRKRSTGRRRRHKTGQ